MPIPASYLDEGEEVLVDLRPHWVFLCAPAVLTAIAFAGALAIAAQVGHAPSWVPAVLVVMVAVPAGWLAARIVQWLGISLVLTSVRLVLRHGFMGREVIEVGLRRLTGVSCEQTHLERLVGTGSLVLERSGNGGTLTVGDVRRPRALQRVLQRRLDLLRGPDLATGPPAKTTPDPTAGEPAPRSEAEPAPSLPAEPHLRPIAPGDPTPPRGVPVVHKEAHDVPGEPDGASRAWSGVAQQLVQLDELHRRGILTRAEFEAKKADLLGRF